MNNARQQIFKRLNTAQALPIMNSSAEDALHFAEATLTAEQKLTQFCAALTANHAEVLQIRREQLIKTIRELSEQKGWHHAAIGTSGPWHSDFRQGLEQVQISEYQQTIDQWKDDLFTTVDVGLTDTRAGIANTGALVLWPDRYEPRTLSLVPPCHVAVIRQSTLFTNLSDIMITQQWQTHMPTNAILISGPSKTADIQQTLAYGAHGPSELVVVVLVDE